MITAREIHMQIFRLTADMIATGLCDDQNFPSIQNKRNTINEISIGNIGTNLFLKNISYDDMYEEMVKQRCYNLKMIDGALVLMQYSFKDAELYKHRLSFFPSPDLLDFQQNEEIYMSEEIYLDILDKRIVTFPFRFDYDCEEKNVNDMEHPISHMTLGQYKNCRIPVSSGVTPYHFLQFIVRNFYHTAYNKFSMKLSKYEYNFSDSISQAERKLIHIEMPCYRMNV